MKKTILTLVNAVCLLTVFTIPASAYIDPATTSYVIQIVAGIIIACGAAVGIMWSKIKRLFKKKDGGEQLDMADMQSGSTDEKDEITAEDLMSDDEQDD